MFFACFTLYPAYNRVGRYTGHLVLGKLHSVPSVEFSRYCGLSGGTKRRSLLRPQSPDMQILNISFPREGMKPTTCRHDWPPINFNM